jgi:hypothetical protein
MGGASGWVERIGAVSHQSREVTLLSVASAVDGAEARYPINAWVSRHGNARGGSRCSKGVRYCGVGACADLGDGCGWGDWLGAREQGGVEAIQAPFLRVEIKSGALARVSPAQSTNRAIEGARVPARETPAHPTCALASFRRRFPPCT